MKKTQKEALRNERRQKRHERYLYKEHLTNWYMLNLFYGILGILIILFIGSQYSSSLLLYMDTIMWVTFGVLLAAAAVMIIVGHVKEYKRVRNYGILSGVCALFALWFALFNKIRLIMESAARAISGNESLSVYSYWNTRLPIIAIAVYLVVSFIVYAVKVTRK